MSLSVWRVDNGGGSISSPPLTPHPYPPRGWRHLPFPIPRVRGVMATPCQRWITRNVWAREVYHAVCRSMWFFFFFENNKLGSDPQNRKWHARGHLVPKPNWIFSFGYQEAISTTPSKEAIIVNNSGRFFHIPSFLSASIFSRLFWKRILGISLSSLSRKLPAMDC